MPWLPELFSAPALARLEEEQRRERLDAVPYFAGLMTGETEALIDSFAGEPLLHHPVRGRVKGTRAFADFVAETRTWLEACNASIEDVSHAIAGPRGFGESVLHLQGENGPVDLPVATVTDLQRDRRIEEIRMYYSLWPLTGRHANRPPVLQPDPELDEPEIVGEYQRALAAGELDAIVAAFEPGGYAREPAGGQYIHNGPEGLRVLRALVLKRRRHPA